MVRVNELEYVSIPFLMNVIQTNKEMKNYFGFSIDQS